MSCSPGRQRACCWHTLLPVFISSYVDFLPAGRVRSVRPSGTVVSFFCLCVCLSVLTSHVSQVTSLRYYATIAMRIVEATGCLQAQLGNRPS